MGLGKLKHASWGLSGISDMIRSFFSDPAVTFRLVALGLAWLSVGAPAAWAMGAYQPALLGEDGVILGDDNLVILEPEKWTGKRFPLLPYIEDVPGQRKAGERPLRERLAEGKWIVVLYHHDCSECQEAIPIYEALARRTMTISGGLRVALIEMPPYAADWLQLVSPEMHSLLGRLSNTKDWFTMTPLVVIVTENEVTNVADQELFIR